ncbi:hypothetical protein P43SY_002148 [Pythium insidiosum]|uniref:Uncharacterized protein n=1 Tax=Pythium insidiosum TaxID=114742 RepID=A0AAD5LHK9_PYTIN|nr:hypothetical protein ATCC90586_004656 [Pythium insidiosum]KAJ0398396.1 hypothetical protein P43SY_002148 [Pythium insidiosum]
MMMTATRAHHESLLQSPKLSAAMTSLSVKRPSLSPLKRKLSCEDEHASPTSTDELVDESVISPKKKCKTSCDTVCTTSSGWMSALVLDEPEDGSDEACNKVLEAYTPVSFQGEAAADLSEEEIEILNFFLS